MIVGEGSNGEEAIELVEQLRPTLVVMDLNMPKKNGIEATARIKARWPETVVIGLSVQAGEEARRAIINAGGAVLLTKEAAVNGLVSNHPGSPRRADDERQRAVAESR